MLRVKKSGASTELCCKPFDKGRDLDNTKFCCTSRNETKKSTELFTQNKQKSISKRLWIMISKADDIQIITTAVKAVTNL